MDKLVKRARVVISDVVTWLVVASSVVVILAEEIAKIVPADWRSVVVEIGMRALAVLGAVVMILRRVTTVLPTERGLLPPED